jgi:hypothetical protein
MRWTLFILVAIFLVGMVSGIENTDGCDTSMVSYWQMEGGASDNYGDNDGSGFPSSGHVILGDAAKFSGLEILTVPNSASLSFIGQFTIELWFKDTATLVDSVLLDKGSYRLEYVIEGSGPFAVKKVRATIGSISVISDSLVGSQYFVAMTWDQNSQKLNLYVNGELADDTISSRPTSSSNALKIGEGLYGSIDEVAAYNTALSAAEISSHYDTINSGRDYCHSTGSSESSTTRSDFNIAGCEANGIILSAGACSIDGNHYCGQNLILYNTILDHTGCSMGASSYSGGSPQCCPAGMLCQVDEYDHLTCGNRVESCDNHTEQTPCTDAGCFWLSEIDGGRCVDRPQDYSCSIYDTEDTCEQDIWNLGQIGEGTDECGTYSPIDGVGYTIPQDSCGCVWNATDEKCRTGHGSSQDIYGNNPNTYFCSKEIAVGECVSGLQHVDQTTWATELTGDFENNPDSSVLLLLREAEGCVDSSSDRDCGEAVVSLPGFSFFALLASLVLIGGFYFLRKDL